MPYLLNTIPLSSLSYLSQSYTTQIAAHKAYSISCGGPDIPSYLLPKVIHHQLTKLLPGQVTLAIKKCKSLECRGIPDHAHFHGIQVVLHDGVSGIGVWLVRKGKGVDPLRKGKDGKWLRDEKVVGEGLNQPKGLTGVIDRAAGVLEIWKDDGEP